MRHAKRLKHKGAAPSPRKVPHSDRDALSLEEETKPTGPTRTKFGVGIFFGAQ